MAAVEEIKRKKVVKKKRRIVKAALSVLVLAAVSFIAAILITNNGKLSLDGLKHLFAGRSAAAAVSEFPFESGFNNVFADLDGGFAVGSTVGVQVFGPDGSKTFTEVYEMANPAIVSAGQTAAAYDLGGKALRVFNTSGILGSVKTDGNIISASLNQNGYLALCTQASGGYKSYVYVYKNGTYDKYQFLWKSGEGYVVSAAVSPDNKNLAVLTLNGTGSRIIFLSLDNGEEKGSCMLQNRLAADIRFTDNSQVLAVCVNALVTAGMNGSSQVLADYADKYLTGYSVNGSGFAALVLSDYMVGEQGRILTVDYSGKTLATLQTGRKIVSVSACGSYLAVLYDDGFAVYDKNLKECAHSDNTAGAVRTIMRSDGTALLITSHSASVFSFKAG